MAIDVQKAVTTDENGLSIANADGDIVVNIGASDFDPTISGLDAPIGSLYLRSNGTAYIKTAAGNTNWTQNTTVPEMSQKNLLAFAARHG